MSAEGMTGKNTRAGISREIVEQMILQVLQEKFGNETGTAEWVMKGTSQEGTCQKGEKEDLVGDAEKKERAEGLIKVEVPRVKTLPKDRLDTGNPADVVYTHDLFSLEESPRLGCGVMEMEGTTFDWHLDYDEIDYVMEGSLTIIKNGNCVTAGPGELILIPKGSSIQFSVPGKARFLYVTYPADWNG